MTKIIVDLNDISRAISLASILAGVNVDFDIHHDRHVVDGKSILGILSLDLSKPVTLIAYTDDEITINFLLQELKEIGAL